jgi:hypothetical protein
MPRKCKTQSAPSSKSESNVKLAPAKKVQKTSVVQRSVSVLSNKSLLLSTKNKAVVVVVSDGESDDAEELEKMFGQ